MDVCSIASVYLAREVAAEVFGAGTRGAGLGLDHRRKAIAVPGGYRVSGSWEFGSGCHHATWLGGHIRSWRRMAHRTSTTRAAAGPLDAVPEAAARIDDVWRTLGLRGTGSDQYTLEDYFIPQEHTITSLFRWPDAQRLKLAAPYRFGGSSL